MKTFVFLTCVLLALLGTPFHHSSVQPLPDNQPLYSEAFPVLPSPAIGGWYLSKGNCPDSEYLICCCSDGNSYACSFPLVYFGCRPGGPFECTQDLADCQEDPSNCEVCCPAGRC